MDISTLDTTGNATLVLKHPATGKDLDITIELPSLDSKRYFDTIEEMSKDKAEKPVKEWQAQIAKKCIVGWENVQMDGKQLECTLENIEKAVKVCPWMLDQITAFMIDRANFLPEPKSE